MVDEYREKIERIFSDVPHEHKFWLIKGGEVKNLEELEVALKDMDDTVFTHHVNDNQNDFAMWIKNVIKDEELYDTLSKIRSKESTIKAIELRINSLKNLRSIHQAIDQIKNKIEDKHDHLENEEKNLHANTHKQEEPSLVKPEHHEIAHEPINVPQKKKVEEKPNRNTGFSFKRFFFDPALYIGLLFGFVVGILLKNYL